MWTNRGSVQRSSVARFVVFRSLNWFFVIENSWDAMAAYMAVFTSGNKANNLLFISSMITYCKLNHIRLPLPNNSVCHSWMEPFLSYIQRKGPIWSLEKASGTMSRVTKLSSEFHRHFQSLVFLLGLRSLDCLVRAQLKATLDKCPNTTS